jgi:peptidoglycan hydrolase-like protein with peptidoglycan-binding domain
MKRRAPLAALMLIPMIIFSSCTVNQKPPQAATATERQESSVPAPQQSEKPSTEKPSKGETPTPSPKPAPEVIISFRLGDSGDKVKEIQQKLNKFGYRLTIDGDFGKLTHTAVVNFQKNNKIKADGIVDKITLEKLNLKPTPATTYKPAPTPAPPSSSVAPKSKEEMESFINGKNLPSSTDYLIWIDLKKQRVNVFTGTNHQWKLVKSMVCSSGKASTPTIKGNFKVGNKGTYFTTSYKSGEKTVTVRCKYFTQISGNYLFHSIIYDKSGEKIIDGTLGVPRSHGCVRLAVENAKYIYDTIPRGTAIWSN